MLILKVLSRLQLLVWSTLFFLGIGSIFVPSQVFATEIEASYEEKFGGGVSISPSYDLFDTLLLFPEGGKSASYEVVVGGPAIVGTITPPTTPTPETPGETPPTEGPTPPGSGGGTPWIKDIPGPTYDLPETDPKTPVDVSPGGGTSPEKDEVFTSPLGDGRPVGGRDPIAGDLLYDAAPLETLTLPTFQFEQTPSLPSLVSGERGTGVSPHAFVKRPDLTCPFWTCPDLRGVAPEEPVSQDMSQWMEFSLTLFASIKLFIAFMLILLSVAFLRTVYGYSLLRRKS